MLPGLLFYFSYELHYIMYKYWGFGLKIQSELKIPELLPASFKNADVTVKHGSIPDLLPNNKVSAEQYEYAIGDNNYFYHIKGTCRYYVSNGCEIKICPDPGIDDRSVRIFLLGSVIAALLLQRNMFPLHVSAILKDQKLILFTGESGAGKSTTLAQLALKGYHVFTDDICVLKHEISQSGEPVIDAYASYPMIKLWKDSAIRLNNNTYAGQDFNVRPGMEKYGHFFFDEFNTNAYPVSKIFVLTKSELPNDEPIERLTGLRAFKELQITIYRKHQLHNNQLLALYFKLINQLISRCEIYLINMQSGYESSTGLKPFPEEYL
jgi:hypothetical protein